MFFIVLFICIGLPWHIQGLEIWSLFAYGSVKFIWDKSPDDLTYFVKVSRNKKQDLSWIRVANPEFTVNDVLLYDIISITVSAPRLSNEYYKKEHKVVKVKSRIGGSAFVSWIAAFFPTNGFYSIFYARSNNKYNVDFEKMNQSSQQSSMVGIIKIQDGQVKYGDAEISTKYSYVTKPYNSTNIMFEIRDISRNDAGYYNGGVGADAARSSGGVVLIVLGKPFKPSVTGDFNVEVNRSVELTCSSQSTSAPDYYSKLVTLSYTWFVNDTKINEKTKETLRLYVTRDLKYNRYSCTATEEDMESDKSGPKKINPLYGPDEIHIDLLQKALVNKTITVQEGETLGRLHCHADCYPRCNITWTYKNASVPVVVYSNEVELKVNRFITLLQCEANWRSQTVKRNAQLDIIYLEKPKIYINGILSSTSIKEVQENTLFRLSCSVEGNPTPIIYLKYSNKSLPNVSLIGDSKKTSPMVENKNWLNYTVNSIQCSDTGYYTCKGSSDTFNTIEETRIQIQVICNMRIDYVEQFNTNYGSTSGKNVMLTLHIPVIANPKPEVSDIFWTGPIVNRIQSTIHPRDVMYKHWIATSVPLYSDAYFGNYTMIYKNVDFLTITIEAKDRPVTPLNFTGHLYNGGYINLTWISEFNGGSEQVFIISKENDNKWEVIANITDPGKGKIVYFETGPLIPDLEVGYRLESCNKINCSKQSPEIKVTFKDLSTGLLLGLNKETYVAIGASVTLFILSVILMVVLMKYCQRKTENEIVQGAGLYAGAVDKCEGKEMKKNDKPETVDERSREDTNGFKTKSAGEMYAAVDKSLLIRNKMNDAALENDKTSKRDGVQHGAEMYAVVDKSLSKKGCESKTTTKLVTTKNSKEKKRKKKGSLEEENDSPVGSRKKNDEGLIYIDVDFTNKAGSSDTNRTPVIHGEEDRTEYTFVDFSKKAPSMQETRDDKGK